MKELKYNLGIVEDPRSEEDKALDFQHSLIAAAPVLNWRVKPQNEWKSYTMRDQDGSSSCVAQACAKAIEIINNGNVSIAEAARLIFSAHPIYRSRINFPEGGMYLQNAGDICKKIGTNLEKYAPSQLLGESKMNRPIDVSTPYKMGGYVMVNPKNIDAIAEAIELYGHCVLLVHCNRKEWLDIPEYNSKLSIDFGHAICAVDYLMFDGKKAILIEDSWGHVTTIGNTDQRIITEPFLLGRISGAMYFTPTKPEPKYVFTKTLKYGMTSTDVKMLQKKLQDLGIFQSSQTITSYFGKITKAAVMAFQKSRNLVPDGIVGKLTNAELNK